MTKTRLGRYALLVVGVVLAATEPVLAQSVNADLIYGLNAKLLYVAIPITLLVQIILVYAVWKFRNNDDPQPTRENRRLEITWTVATAIILLFVGVASYTVLGSPAIALTADENQAQPQAQQQIQPSVTHPNRSGATAPDSKQAVEIEIDAFQWGWEFIYPDAGVNSSTELAVPANKSVYLHITSRDVIHAVHVPALGLKQDAIPGEYNTIMTNATEPGTYQLYCAEFCGSGHSKMLANMTVMPQDEYQSWLDEQKSGSGSNESAGGSANSSSLAPVAANPA
ncbi:cytochrome c oxidase subunit II [Halococcus thailandensis]|uniref:cytochrome-c oxidase n=1 Tax=Halococcus thailandensis JCM 13552 TaxID=1227457 RepID=M0N1L6_9EURY|nr:cytochrome c oxidase subunit II [Halococcus thailandensis]EMA51428.1 cytochrome c oxidase subunit II [Halococcus thailandensis JCM 13552]